MAYRVYARKKTGWHSFEWRKETIKEAKEQGHDLESFVSPDTLFKSQPVRFTCRHCKRLQIETDVFRRQKCKEYAFPNTKVWRALRLKCSDSTPNLLKVWGWGKKELRQMEARAASDRVRGL